MIGHWILDLKGKGYRVGIGGNEHGAGLLWEKYRRQDTGYREQVIWGFQHMEGIRQGNGGRVIMKLELGGGQEGAGEWRQDTGHRIQGTRYRRQGKRRVWLRGRYG